MRGSLGSVAHVCVDARADAKRKTWGFVGTSWALLRLDFYPECNVMELKQERSLGPQSVSRSELDEV